MQTNLFLFNQTFTLNYSIILLFFNQGGGSINNGSSYSTDLMRKPTRLEALPNMDKKNSRTQKRSGPILNTMGTF